MQKKPEGSFVYFIQGTAEYEIINYIIDVDIVHNALYDVWVKTDYDEYNLCFFDGDYVHYKGIDYRTVEDFEKLKCLVNYEQTIAKIEDLD